MLIYRVYRYAITSRLSKRITGKGVDVDIYICIRVYKDDAIINILSKNERVYVRSKPILTWRFYSFVLQILIQKNIPY